MGTFVGNSIGVTVGVELGLIDGSFIGEKDGLFDGIFEGVLLGKLDGFVDGNCVGFIVGFTLGTIVGPANAPTITEIDLNAEPTIAPTFSPTAGPTTGPSPNPTNVPFILIKLTDLPSYAPTAGPTESPQIEPTFAPTYGPTAGPTKAPFILISLDDPTFAPTYGPTAGPTESPQIEPTYAPTYGPTAGPTTGPTTTSNARHTLNQTLTSVIPTFPPTFAPTMGPTMSPISVSYSDSIINITNNTEASTITAITNGININIQLDNDIIPSISLPNDFFDCELIFTKETIYLFGNNSFCSWTQNEVNVKLGFNHNVDITDNSILVFAEGILTSLAKGNYIDDTLVHVVASDNIESPSVVISGSRYLSYCDNLELYIGSVGGNMGKSLQYTWYIYNNENELFDLNISFSKHIIIHNSIVKQWNTDKLFIALHVVNWVCNFVSICIIIRELKLST